MCTQAERSRPLHDVAPRPRNDSRVATRPFCTASQSSKVCMWSEPGGQGPHLALDVLDAERRVEPHELRDVGADRGAGRVVPEQGLGSHLAVRVLRALEVGAEGVQVGDGRRRAAASGRSRGSRRRAAAPSSSSRRISLGLLLAGSAGGAGTAMPWLSTPSMSKARPHCGLVCLRGAGSEDHGVVVRRTCRTVTALSRLS